MSDNVVKTIKGISSQTVITLILGILELVVFSIMSRLITKTEFGYYATITSIIVIFRSLSEAGIGASVIQKNKADTNFVNTAYSLSLIVGVVITIIVLAFTGFLSELIADKTIQLPLAIISITIIPYSLNSIYRGLFLKGLHFLKVGIFQIIAFVISNSIAIVMAWKGCGLYSIVVGNVLNIILQNIILRTFLPYKPKFVIKGSHVKEIINFGGWLTLSKMTGALYAQIDKILMAKWLSITTLGNFYRTRGVIDSVDSQVGGIFDVVLFPILSGIQDKKESVQNAYIKAMYLGCVFFSLLFLTFFFNAKLIITVMLGEKWLDQVLLFRVLSLSMLLYFLTRLNDCFIRSLAYVRFGFFVKLFSCFMLVTTMYLSIRQGYGTIGVAVSVVFTNLLSAIIKTAFICLKTDVRFLVLFKNIIRGLLYSIPLLCFGITFFLFFEQNLIYSIIFCAVFVLASTAIFLFLPDFVGSIYKKQIYPYISRILNVDIISINKQK